MACHLQIVEENNLNALEADSIETRLDHPNVWVRIRWCPANWTGWSLELVVGRQDEETVDVFMQGSSAENRTNVKVMCSSVAELQGDLDEFFSDLNERHLAQVLNVEPQPRPVMPSELISEIQNGCERIRQSLIRGEILRARHLRRL